MHSCEHNFETRRKECHRVLSDTGAFGKKIRLTMEAATDGFLAYWSSNDRAKSSRKRFGACCLEVCKGAAAGQGTEPPPFNTRRIACEVVDEKDRIVIDERKIFNPAIPNTRVEESQIAIKDRAIDKEHPSAER